MKTRTRKEVMLRLNKSLVRPHVDYCLSAWSPHHVKDKLQVEKVLRRFTKMIPEMQNHSYEARLKKLHLWSLEERRNRSDIIEVFTMFKCISGIYRLKRFSKGHSAKIKKNRRRTDLPLPIGIPYHWLLALLSSASCYHY